MGRNDGTEWRGKTVRRESTVNCRDWLEFQVTEITLSKVRYRYRAPVKPCIEATESVQFPKDELDT